MICRVSSSRPRPTPSTPALLEMTVRFFAPGSFSASISASGMPQRPKPPAHDSHAVLDQAGERALRVRKNLLHSRKSPAWPPRAAGPVFYRTGAPVAKRLLRRMITARAGLLLFRRFGAAGRVVSTGAGALLVSAGQPSVDEVHVIIDDRRDVERQHLRDGEAADDGDARAAGAARAPAPAPSAIGTAPSGRARASS